MNITFLSASSNSTLVILLREKKNYLLSSWEMVPVHEEKTVMHKLLSKHHDVMYKKLSPCALPPAVGWGVPRAHLPLYPYLLVILFQFILRPLTKNAKQR